MKRCAIALLAATVLSVGLSQIASAADLPVKAPVYKAPAAVPVSDWTGFYVGASVGGRWDSSVWTTTSLEGPGFPPDPFDNPHRFTDGSLRAGGYLGYNWQVSPSWVVGIEGDFAWADNNSSAASIPGASGASGTGDTASVKDTWDGGIRGRVGYLINPTLMLFGTGGVSWLHSEASAHCGTNLGWCADSNLGRTDTASSTVAGWTIGGGLEAMLTPNWLVRGEYRYSRYNSYDVVLLAGGAVGTLNGNGDTTRATIGSHDKNTALIGIAYKFGR
jgi:outer membrane immunogenic protein